MIIIWPAVLENKLLPNKPTRAIAHAYVFKGMNTANMLTTIVLIPSFKAQITLIRWFFCGGDTVTQSTIYHHNTILLKIIFESRKAFASFKYC